MNESARNRFEAAMKIGNRSDRDEVLARIAPDAARECDADLVKRIVKAVYYDSTRDKVIEAVAPILAGSGYQAAAIELANSVYYSDTKDRVLKRIL